MLTNQIQNRMKRVVNKKTLSIVDMCTERK